MPGLSFSWTAPKQKNTITISGPGGPIQGSSVNPQSTATVQAVQPAASVTSYQGGINSGLIQGGSASTVQRAASAWSVQNAADAIRRANEAAIAEAARQKQVRKEAAQVKLNEKVSANTAATKLIISSIPQKNRVKIGALYAPSKIIIPKYTTSEQDQYNRWMAEGQKEAQKQIDAMLADPSTDRWSRFVDKVSFGADRRKNNARKFAEQYAKEYADRQVKIYESKINKHNALVASLQADYERKKLTLPPADLNVLAANYEQQIAASVSGLQRIAAITEGKLKGYDKNASMRLSSFAGNAVSTGVSAIKKFASDKNPIWRATLGGGWENVPSLVTAPSRAVNWVGNINTKDRTIYQHGGTSFNRAQSGKNAWQATFNQRNVNLKPVIDRKFDKVEAYKMMRNESSWGQQPAPDVVKAFNAAKSDAEKEKIARKAWNDENKYKRWFNSGVETLVDPLLGVGKVGKAGRALSRFEKVQKFAEKAKWFKTTAMENKVVKWLNAEHKSSGEILRDTIDEAKKTQGALQDAHFSRIRQIDRKISGGQVDFSSIDEISKLTESEAKILQRMVDGKLTMRDRLLLAGKNYEPIRTKLEDIASRWQTFSEQMKLSDNVKSSRFGKGKRTYSPNTVWTNGDRSKYNFRLKSKGAIQNKDDFAQGIVDRYLSSSVGKNAKFSKNRLLAERERLIADYEATMAAERAKVAKVERWAKSPVQRAKRIAGAPMRLWKKSVLSWRPAWTVNNIGYNTQASVLSGGVGALVEQVKMLNPRYWRQIMDQVPHDVFSNLGKEIGQKGRLNRFYSNVENLPRVAAYRNLRAKGLSHEQSLQRVNRYMLQYNTKNWERPLKAVVPFWSFQKGVSKAAASMPFDRPGYALAYNKLDREQRSAFSRDFKTLVPELQSMGYTDAEISQFEEKLAAKFAGKLKIGSKYFNTPFNAFSEKGLAGFGLNPFLAALQETIDSTDSFGQKLKGNEADLKNRLISKFPQLELGRKATAAWRVSAGYDKPSQKYIGKAGGDGFGLTKEKQGYDKNAPNYVAWMDPRKGLKQDALAFLGKPRDLAFDKPAFIEAKKLQRVTAEYFAKSADWKNMDYETAQAQQAALFKKFGLTADEFYKGILSKYDSEHAKKIKALKENAAAKNKSLFEEYARVPQGKRNMWATQKLRELNAAGYFDSNPYLKSFKWINSETAAKADRQAAFVSGRRSAKDIAYTDAKRSGDWTAYRKKYGTKSTPYSFQGKFFKSNESMARYIAGQEKVAAAKFWQQYADADPEQRKLLLAENPQFNTRKDWTPAMWSAWKSERRRSDTAKLRGWGAASRMDNHVIDSKQKAAQFAATRKGRPTKKLAYA